MADDRTASTPLAARLDSPVAALQSHGEGELEVRELAPGPGQGGRGLPRLPRGALYDDRVPFRAPEAEIALPARKTPGIGGCGSLAAFKGGFGRASQGEGSRCRSGGYPGGRKPRGQGERVRSWREEPEDGRAPAPSAGGAPGGPLSQPSARGHLRRKAGSRSRTGAREWLQAFSCQRLDAWRPRRTEPAPRRDPRSLLPRDGTCDPLRNPGSAPTPRPEPSCPGFGNPILYASSRQEALNWGPGSTPSPGARTSIRTW